MARTMSGSLNKVWRRQLSRCLLSSVAGMALAGCVSTEELYAEYDAIACPVRLDTSQQNPSIIEVATRDSFRWEQSVYFEFDQSFVDSTAAELIDRDIKVLLRFPSLHVSVQGFTDRIGSERYNDDLSSRRVNAVTDYLVKNGVSENRIVLSPRGKGIEGIAGNDNTSRQRNRRVELMLLDAKRHAIPLLLDPALVAGTIPGVVNDPVKGSEPGLEAASPADAAGAKPDAEPDDKPIPAPAPARAPISHPIPSPTAAPTAH